MRAAGSERRWAIVRIVLGQAQITSAVVSLVLLLQIGASEPTLWAVAVTCAFMTASTLLVRGERSG